MLLLTLELFSTTFELARIKDLLIFPKSFSTRFGRSQHFPKPKLFNCCTTLGKYRPNRRKIFHYRFAGCWKDKSRRALRFRLGTFRGRNAIRRCFMKAVRKGLRVFSLQNGSQCWADRKVRRYKMYGRSRRCRKWRGGPWSNSVYRIGTGTECWGVRNTVYYDFDYQYDFLIRLNSWQEFAKSLSGQISWPFQIYQLRELLKIS